MKKHWNWTLTHLDIVIPMYVWTNESCIVILHVENLTLFSEEEKQCSCQFAHAPKEKLICLLKNSVYEDKEFCLEVENYCDNYDHCIRYKHSEAKPIVSLPKVDRFNKVVYMDLKEVTRGKLYLRLDSAIRYTKTTPIQSKKEDIVDKNFKTWLWTFTGNVKKNLISFQSGEWQVWHKNLYYTWWAFLQ